MQNWHIIKLFIHKKVFKSTSLYDFTTLNEYIMVYAPKQHKQFISIKKTGILNFC